jgi:ribosomal protein S18 acetylase RimI-like enzyme
MSDDDTLDDLRHRRIAMAADPRPAAPNDAPRIASLFASAFMADPVMSWVAREGPQRRPALERFFHWIVAVRAIPFGEVWMADDCSVAAAWLPPGAPASPGGILEQIKLLPMFLQLCGWSRMLRGQAMGDAMEENHPHEPHYYLSFIAVAPQFRGLGLGSALLEANLARIDAARMPAYLENSNPRNTRLYERSGFATQKNIAPDRAPPLMAMWRAAR